MTRSAARSPWLVPPAPSATARIREPPASMTVARSWPTGPAFSTAMAKVGRGIGAIGSRSSGPGLRLVQPGGDHLADLGQAGPGAVLGEVPGGVPVAVRE